MLGRRTATIFAAVTLLVGISSVVYAGAEAAEQAQQQDRAASRDHATLILAFPDTDRAFGLHIEGRGVEIHERAHGTERFELRPGGYHVTVTFGDRIGTLDVRLDGVHKYQVSLDDRGNIHFERVRAHDGREAPERDARHHDARVHDAPARGTDRDGA